MMKMRHSTCSTRHNVSLQYLRQFSTPKYIKFFFFFFLFIEILIFKRYHYLHQIIHYSFLSLPSSIPHPFFFFSPPPTMTVSKLFSHTVQQWYDMNGDVPCTSHNGRTALVSVSRQVYLNKNDKQSDIAVRNTVHLTRRLILPTHNHHHLIKPNIANETTRSKRSRWSYNQYWNPIYNPINSARAKIVRRELNIKLIQCDPIRSSRLLNNNTINRTFNNLFRERKYEQFGGMTLEVAMNSGQYAIYVVLRSERWYKRGCGG